MNIVMCTHFNSCENHSKSKNINHNLNKQNCVYAFRIKKTSYNSFVFAEQVSDCLICTDATYHMILKMP